jgi:hypothetical protein
MRGDRVFVQTTDSDAVARHFLAATAAHDVEIVAHNLEDVLLTLTDAGWVEVLNTPGRDLPSRLIDGLTVSSTS